MIIETRYNLGDTIWYFSKSGIKTGVVDDIEICTFSWVDIFGENATGEETVEGPSVLYRMKTSKYGNTGQYKDSQLWRTREEMPI